MIIFHREWLMVMSGRNIIPHHVASKLPAAVRRARILNLSPAYIININTDHVETFKSALDIFLSQIMDQPT